MSADGVGSMHGDITEPLDWFAADATQDDLTVPDWGLGTYYPATSWEGGAPTQPALSFDSAVLSGLPLQPPAPSGAGSRWAMRIYVITTLLLLSALFGMFFVFGGRFQSTPPRSQHTSTLIAAAALPGQNAIVKALSPLPHDDSLPKTTHVKPTPPPKPAPPPPASGDGNSLWADVTTPATNTTIPPLDAAEIPAIITQMPSSLWPTTP